MRFDAERPLRDRRAADHLSALPLDAAAGVAHDRAVRPTWEGAQPSVAYSSVRTHGSAREALLADDRYRVLYRPTR